MIKAKDEGNQKDGRKAADQKGPAKKFDMFDDMMGGDDDSDGPDLMDFDFSAPPKAPKSSALKAKPTKNDTNILELSLPK